MAPEDESQPVAEVERADPSRVSSADDEDGVRTADGPLSRVMSFAEGSGVLHRGQVSAVGSTSSAHDGQESSNDIVTVQRF